MINTYYIDVTQFEDEALFTETWNLLSPCRQEKIARVRHRKDKNRSLGAGVALDYALKRYGLKEIDMEYAFGEWGKPSLKYYPDIHFSLSHSGDYAICSIGDAPVGNDIEHVRGGKLKVADRFFAPEELTFLYAVQDEEEITQRMFRIWTMKESFLKVTGRGISIPMGEFCILIGENTDKIVVRQSFHKVRYHMKEYNEIPGYRAAVCSQEDVDVACRMEPVLLL